MMDVIITGGNSSHFNYLELFVSSLRNKGAFNGKIIVCDNSIEGTWDKPGKFIEGVSFSSDQMLFFKKHKIDVIPYTVLIAENKIDRRIIDQIPSPTQRYPHKFIYTTLISKRYSDPGNQICFFDADIYFQKPIQPLFDSFLDKGIFIIKEGNKIGNNYFLSKWIRYSDFSSFSNQQDYLKKMDSSENFCTGFFGGDAESFHAFSLLCMLLASNNLVRFYSDQPTVNILKSFLKYPTKELSWDNVIHLGDLQKEDIEINNTTLYYKKKASIAVHFNGDTKDFFSIIQNAYKQSEGGNNFKASHWEKLKSKTLRFLRRWKNRLFRK